MYDALTVAVLYCGRSRRRCMHAMCSSVLDVTPVVLRERQRVSNMCLWHRHAMYEFCCAMHDRG